VQKPDDRHEVVEKKLNEYRDFLAAAETEFSKCLIRINAEEDTKRVFLNFCDAVENSV
jgi:adenylate kinase family enzyme